jgi:hypothetical protein
MSQTARTAARSAWLAACLALAAATSARGQLRESFESAHPSWSLAQADCGVKKLLHERTFRDSRSGSGSERIKLRVGQGTFVYLTHPIGKCPVIAELAPSLWVKSDKPSVQLLVRVVYPRFGEPATGKPVTSLLMGDFYTEVGTWQQLRVGNIQKLVERDANAKRRELGKTFSEKEAYIDLIVVNAYSSPGDIDLWIDDLEIEGYLNLGEHVDAPELAPSRSEGDPRRGAALQGSLLVADQRPMMPRVIEHRGEPLAWLKSLGFSAVKLSASPSDEVLEEAARLKLWLIAPPPYRAHEERLDARYDVVLAWSLGSRLTERDLSATRQLADEVRAIDPRAQRPLVCGAAADLAGYSRQAGILVFDQPTLGTSFELAAWRWWLDSRSRLTRPGTPFWAAMPTHLSLALREQVIQMGQPAPWNEDLDWAEMRLLVYSALAAGAKGFVFQSQVPLHTDSNAGAHRVHLLKLLNYELLLLEPWGAGGASAEPIDTGNPLVQAAVVPTERSRLVLITRHMPAQQFAAGPPDGRPVSIVVPGVPISDRAYRVTLAGPRELKAKTTSGGLRITIDDPDVAEAVVITQDPLVLHHFHRVLGEGKHEIARLRYALADRRWTTTSDIDQELTRLGHPLAGAEALLREARGHLDLAQRAHESGDWMTLHAAAARCERALAKVRRGHWQQAAGAFPSPASSPCIARYEMLPAHFAFAGRMRSRPWGPNVLSAGDMESLQRLLESGWKQHRALPQGMQADVGLSLLSPHSGRSALRIFAGPLTPQGGPAEIERPPLWITTAPVPVRQGQLVRIHGWVQVPRRLAASAEGLLIFDSLTGPELGERIQLTQGWREFSLYRAVPDNGELTITFSLTGLGEAWLDDVSVSLIDPDPIRETSVPGKSTPR